MRRKRYFMAGGKILIALGFVSMIGSIILAYSNNFSPLPWNPSIVIQAGIMGLIGFITFGSLLIWFDTSWLTIRHRDMAPYTPDRNNIARVIISAISDKEYFVYGSPDEKVHDVVQNDWPFDNRDNDEHWYVLDSSGNDVSEKLYSEVEGTLQVVFD